jgi:hypothetical protein
MQTLVLLLCGCALASALNFTQPRAGAVLDPSTQITISWTTDPNDPAFINLALANSEVTGSSQSVATNVSTAGGKYVIPSTDITIATTGTNDTYVIVANTPGGQGNAFVGQSGNFMLESGGASTTATASSTASTATSSNVASLIHPTMAAYAGAALLFVLQ